MSGFWRRWMEIWAWSVVLFGAVLIACGLPGMDGLMLGLLGVLGDAPADVAPALRFAWALMGAVSLGWGLTLVAFLRAIDGLGAAAAAPAWRMLTVSVFAWYMIDSLMSVATGFALNAGSNTLLLIGYLVPVLVTGVIGRRAATA